MYRQFYPIQLQGWFKRGDPPRYEATLNTNHGNITGSGYHLADALNQLANRLGNGDAEVNLVIENEIRNPDESL